MIGIVAVALTGICAGGLLLFYLFPPAGQHRKSPGRHRDHGETHEGYADNEERLAELHHLHNAVDFARQRRDRIGGS